MKTALGSAALLSALVIASPAAAARIVLEGVAEVSDTGLFYFPLPPENNILQGSEYTLSVQFSRAAVAFVLGYEETFCEDLFFGDGGSDTRCGSLDPLVAEGENTDFGSVTFTPRTDYDFVFVNEDSFLEGERATYWIGPFFGSYAEFASLDPVGYRIVLDGPVPEPAAWVLMIAGFGLVGGALRSRRPVAKLAAFPSPR